MGTTTPAARSAVGALPQAAPTLLFPIPGPAPRGVWGRETPRKVCYQRGWWAFSKPVQLLKLMEAALLLLSFSLPLQVLVVLAKLRPRLLVRIARVLLPVCIIVTNVLRRILGGCGIPGQRRPPLTEILMIIARTILMRITSFETAVF